MLYLRLHRHLTSGDIVVKCLHVKTSLEKYFLSVKPIFITQQLHLQAQKLVLPTHKGKPSVPANLIGGPIWSAILTSPNGTELIESIVFARPISETPLFYFLLRCNLVECSFVNTNFQWCSFSFHENRARNSFKHFTLLLMVSELVILALTENLPCNICILYLRGRTQWLTFCPAFCVPPPYGTCPEPLPTPVKSQSSVETYIF